jgi:hypothetical protein
LASGHLQSLDGLLIYRQAIAIAYHGSLHFQTPIWWGAPIDTSKYGVGLSLLYLPGLLLFSFLSSTVPLQHGQTYDFGLLYRDPLYAVAAAPVQAILAAATAYLVARLLLDLGFSRRIALFGLLLYGIGSPAIVYARGDWAQPLSGFCWLAALVAALRIRKGSGWPAMAACGAAVGYGVLARPVEGSLVVPFVLLILVAPSAWKSRRALTPLAVVAGCYVVALAITLLVDWGRYGSPTRTGYGPEGWTTPILTGLGGSVLSPVRGILWQFPAVVLAVLGVKLFWRVERTMAIALGGIALVQLVNVGLWDVWWGGANWGLRLFVPAFPLLAVLAAAGLRLVPRAVEPAVGGVVLLAGLAWAVPCVVTDLFGGYTILADGSSGAFHFDAMPLIGAWQFIHHLRAVTLTDGGAIDIIWLRLARTTHNLSLIAPVLLGGVAALLGLRAAQIARTYNGTNADLPGGRDRAAAPGLR